MSIEEHARIVQWQNSGLSIRQQEFDSPYERHSDPELTPFVPIMYWRRRIPINGTINGLEPMPDADYWEFVASKGTRQVFRKAAQQGWLCFYCWLPLEEDRKRIVREHRIPRSKGGNNHGNIVASCVGCDQRKADREWPPAAYIRQKRQTYLAHIGIKHDHQSARWNKVFPNLGKGPDGEPLWAPQYGFV